MAEKVGLAPGARETFKVLHGKKLDDSIEHHAEGGIIGIAKGLFGGGSKSGGGLFGSLFGGGDSNKSSDGLEDVSTSSKPTDMRTRDEIAKDMGSVSAAGIIGANMSSSKVLLVWELAKMV